MVKPRASSSAKLRARVVTFAMLSLTLLNAIQGKNGYDQSTSMLNEVAWSAAYLVAAAGVFAQYRQVPGLLARSLPLAAFVGLAFVSTAWSVDPAITLKNSIELIGTTLLGFYIVASLELVEFLDVLAVFFGTSAAASLLLIFVSPGRGRMFWGSGPWEGVYEEKNALGAAMAIAILVFIAYLLRRDAKFKPAAAFGLALSAVLLAGSDSATALVDCLAVLGIGVVAIACAARAYAGPARTIAILAGLALLAGAAAIGFNPDALYGLLGRSEELSGRADFWPYLVDAVKARPILGHGYGAFFRSPVAKDYLSYYVVQAGGWTPYHAHNSFLQACLDTGLVGLTALLVLIASSLARALRFFWRVRDVDSLWPLAIVAFLVLGSFTETYLGNFNTLGWILFVTAYLYPVRVRLADAKPAPKWRAAPRVAGAPGP